MQLKRIFTTIEAKGSVNYINSQKKYEIIRTLGMFAISLILFFAGYIQTKTKANLLTIVAVLGLLPACKSLISMIMYVRYRSLSPSAVSVVQEHLGGLNTLFDCVFTSEHINYQVGHMAICGNTVCGYTEDVNFKESEFYAHIQAHLKLDGHKEVTVKIYSDLNKYTARLDQMQELESDQNKTSAIISTIKSIIL